MGLGWFRAFVNCKSKLVGRAWPLFEPIKPHEQADKAAEDNLCSGLNTALGFLIDTIYSIVYLQTLFYLLRPLPIFALEACNSQMDTCKYVMCVVDSQAYSVKP